MKNRMMECLFVKPLSFLRIWGALDGPADEVKIYLGLRCIGLQLSESMPQKGGKTAENDLKQ